MPGTRAGTGQPISFACAIERREKLRVEFGMMLRREHRVIRTGRTRPYRRIGQGNMRTSTTAHEYRCSCGHVGWSAHVDLPRHTPVMA